MDDELNDELDEDEYEDEYEQIDDEMVRRSLSSLRLDDEDFDDEAEDFELENNRRNINTLISRRILISQGKIKEEAPQHHPSNPKPTAPTVILVTNFTNPWKVLFPPGADGSNQLPKTVIFNLLISYQLRENLLYIFGCLLQRPVGFLTEQQYTSLNILFIELRNRPSTIHLALKELKNVPVSNLNEQMSSIMKILEKILPPYIGCSANFWVQEIEKKKINLNSMPSNTCPSNFNILEKINVNIIKIQTIMKPIDAPSRMTEYVLGKIFVKILYDIQKLKVVLSQAIFGIILANFPNIPFNPILNENIKFILYITLKAEIPGWHEIELQPVSGDPYRFIKTIITKILVIHNVPRPIKEALTYIKIHLRPVNIHHVNPEYPIIQQFDNHEQILELLLSFIVPKVYSPELICLKVRFLELVKDNSFHQSWMLNKIDRLRYTNSLDMLLAYLTKLQRNIPNPNSDKARTVTTLLSLLIIDKQNKQFTPVSKNLDFLLLLGYLSNPYFPPNVNVIYNKILQIVLNKPDLQVTMFKLVPTQKGKCIVIDKCLKEILQNLEQTNQEIPRQMEKIIFELNEIIPIQTTNPNCKIISNDGNHVPPKVETDKDIKKEYGNSPGLPGNGFPGGNLNTEDPNNIGGDFGKGDGTDNGDRNKPRDKNPTIIVNNPQWITNILLPPMMSPTQNITIYINDKGTPALDCPNIKIYPGNSKLTMPSVIILLKPPELNDPFGIMNLDFKVNILDPIIQISGSSDLTLILGTKVQDLITSGRCPTMAALIIILLEKAKSNSLVKANTQLLNHIMKFLSGLDLMALITLPIVMRVIKIYPAIGIIYSVINLADPYKSRISALPPYPLIKGTLVFAIVDPNKLKEPVDPADPFKDLLPDIGHNLPGGEYIRELKIIFTRNKISQLLPNFKPDAYQNKGLLLIVLLQKLPKTSEIIANPRLKKIILDYIWAIVIPAFFTKVSYLQVINILGNEPQVKPDTAILINILPPPRDEKEKKMFHIMKILLQREDLFEILNIPKPTPSTTQKELLKIIILGVLSSPRMFNKATVIACRYYKDQIFDIKKGNTDIVWEFEARQLITLKTPLGKIIENVINYDELTNAEKNAYNNLIKYLHEVQNIFSLCQDFPIAKYKTEGTFLKGLFSYLLEKSLISQEAKNNIIALLPHLRVNGRGDKPLQLIFSSQENPSGGRRGAWHSLSKFKINV